MQPMTTHAPEPGPLVNRFPHPGRQLEQAYRELNLAINGTAEQRKALGSLKMLPRPWDPDSLTRAPMRRELWDWLEAFTIWLNTEYAWDVVGVVPNCWPQHPHLVRELAVLADQRRWAALAFGSDALEEWHRYALPAFVERMRQRVKNHCEDGHQQWPAKGRHSRHVGDSATAARAQAFDQDVAAHQRPTPADDENAGPWLHLVDGQTVDTETGEIVDGQPPLG
jgi:hypothetical protein